MFPEGQLLVREFSSLTEAHLAASGLSSSPAFTDAANFRLIDVSSTAGGAWVCAWVSRSNLTANGQIAEEGGFDLVDVDSKVMDALLSLGPKAKDTATHVGIIESTRIADVLRSVMFYVSAGFTLLEVRVKRAGPTSGAHAFFSLDSQLISKLNSITKPSARMTTIPLLGDYRRYFL